jgi:hypothetical protein
MANIKSSVNSLKVRENKILYFVFDLATHILLFIRDIYE